MTTKHLLATTVVLFSLVARSQPLTKPQPPLTLLELNRTPWPHLGGPPAADQATQRESSQEAAKLAQALDSIKGSWTKREPLSTDELQFRVQQYEDLIGTIAQSSGYGNVLLADCLRRLSLTLMIEYALAHPDDSNTLAEMIKGRIHLLDSQVVAATLAEELKLNPPSGGWRLTEDRAQMELVFRAAGTNYREQSGRVFALPSNSTLLKRHDFPGVLVRVIESDVFECVHLPGLIEFHKLGGRLESLRAESVQPYVTVMEGEMRRFQFPPVGINMVRQEHLVGLLEIFDPRGQRINGFTRLALE